MLCLTKLKPNPFMNKSLSILLLCLLPYFANAQYGKSVPGFLGAKNCISISLQPNINPSVDLLNQLVHPGKGLQYEIVTSRRGSVSVGYTVQNIKIDEYSYEAFDYKDNDLSIPNFNIYDRTRYEGTIDINEKHFFIAKTYYHLSMGSIAPQGGYIRFKYNMYSQKITDDQMEYSNGTVHKKNPNGAALYKTQNMSSVGIELGRKRFINKNIFIEKSVAFNLPNNFWSTSSDQIYRNIEDFNETHMNYYMSKNRTLQFHISLGFAF